MPQLEAITEKKSIRIEPSERWVRVKVGGEYVADSRRTLLVWDNHYIPAYFFPRDDVRTDLLQETGRGRGERSSYDIAVNGKTTENAAYSYTNPGLERVALKDYVAFRWDKMDHWYEEEEEIFVHPRDPHKRIDVMRSSRHVRVAVDGVVVAASQRPYLLFETDLPVRYYLPREDVNMDYLTPTDTVTHCPYKGAASAYWTVAVNDTEIKDAVWCYPESIIPEIEGLLCFFNEKVDLYVDGELQQRPQTHWS